MQVISNNIFGLEVGIYESQVEVKMSIIVQHATYTLD